MKQKLRIKNIIIATSLITTFALLVLFDHQRVQNEFISLKAELRKIRLKTVTENKPLIVKFNANEISILDYKKGELLKTIKYDTISDVNYDTKIGKNMIVFHGGTTNRFNKRIHGGEIALRSWFGFKKYIHVNCAGYVGEGRYPED